MLFKLFNASTNFYGYINKILAKKTWYFCHSLFGWYHYLYQGSRLGLRKSYKIGTRYFVKIQVFC